MEENSVKIAFRTDSSLQIGSGHVMRCLTLADELRQRGADILFVCREHTGNMIGLIEGKGYPVALLPKEKIDFITSPEDVAHAAWLGVSWQQDATDTIIAIGDVQPQWLIIDHYAIDSRWEKMLRTHVSKVMIIDDLADRPHNCDLLLDQNLYQAMETRYTNLIPESCHKLLGPKYALLRPEFTDVRKNIRQRDGQIKRVLVFFGGVDPTNETEKVMQVLASIADSQLEVDVVTGGGNLRKSDVNNFCSQHDGFHYHSQVDNMAELLAAADLAIGAGGTATWERCAVGIPAIVFAIADNQKELSETGARNGLFFYVGEASSVSSERLLHVLKFCMSFPETMEHYSANGFTTVDAKGVNRVANIISPPPVTVRRASLNDCDSIYEWRNAEETRRYIFDAKPIPLQTHRDWYRNTLENPNRTLLIGEIDNKPVGVLRYDFTDYEALVSVYLVPGGQGHGVGSQLLRCGSQWVRENYRHIRFINAEIFRENIASLRAFELAGYKEHHMTYQEAL